MSLLFFVTKSSLLSDVLHIIIGNKNNKAIFK